MMIKRRRNRKIKTIRKRWEEIKGTNDRMR